jgi:hypothetical protein
LASGLCGERYRLHSSLLETWYTLFKEEEEEEEEERYRY